MHIMRHLFARGSSALRWRRIGNVGIALAIVAACAPLPTQQQPADADAVRDLVTAPDPWTVQPQAQPPATPPVAIVAPGVGTQDGHPGRDAVASLAAKARREQQAGALDAAAATLERALRLDPRNARLWHQLAGVHFDQRHWRQSAEFATRSNALATDDKDLQALNWRLIAQVREATGDPQGATHAYDQAARLERD